ncbi:hypothetical protein QMT05_19485 [Cronobacter malonaticus]|nr:hypothetical protein [Cronobacter malonaticus]MDK1176044.1 hypothetical protein [Cronobacter malonaticus]MDK1689146.1 hypothetical protein [Cronobacter malonaticus]
MTRNARGQVVSATDPTGHQMRLRFQCQYLDRDKFVGNKFEYA